MKRTCLELALLIGSLLLGLEELLDALVQVGDDLSLGDHQSRAGAEVDGSIGANGSVLTSQTTNAEAEGLADGLGLGVSAIGSQVGHLDVHRGSHSSAQVGGARGDVSKVLAVGKLAGDVLYDVASSLEAVENIVQHGSLLHRHDAQVVLLSDPDDEASVLGLVRATPIRL